MLPTHESSVSSASLHLFDPQINPLASSVSLKTVAADSHPTPRAMTPVPSCDELSQIAPPEPQSTTSDSNGTKDDIPASSESVPDTPTSPGVSRHQDTVTAVSLSPTESAQPETRMNTPQKWSPIGNFDIRNQLETLSERGQHNP